MTFISTELSSARTEEYELLFTSSLEPTMQVLPFVYHNPTTLYPY